MGEVGGAAGRIEIVLTPEGEVKCSVSLPPQMAAVVFLGMMEQAKLLMERQFQRPQQRVALPPIDLSKLRG